MTKEHFLGAATIIVALLLYFFNFNEWVGFSSEKGDWGTFGDFVGGLSNPIITFITMCMLIKSIDLQRSANQSLIEQNKQTKENEEIRSFETSFYSLAEVTRKEFDQIKIHSDEVYEGLAAVTYIENQLSSIPKNNKNSKHENILREKFNAMDDASHMAIYSSVRGFYVLCKLTAEMCPVAHRERYMEICLNITPVKLIHLVCMALVFANWDNLENIRKYGFLAKPGVKDYIDGWTQIRDQLDDDI